MESKEIIKNQIVALKEQAQIEKELETGNEIYYEAEIKEYNQVLKDLEELEELKKIMGTPIQDIMKRLKVLEILKDSYVLWVEKGELLCGRYADREITLDREYFESDEDYVLVKEYLDGKD